MRISFRLRALVTTLFASAMLLAVMPTAEAQVWKPRTKPKPAAAVKRPAKARPRPKPTAKPVASKPVANNNGARPIDLVPDDEDVGDTRDTRDTRDVRVVRDAPPTRSGGNDRRVGDTEVFVVIND